MKKSTMELGGSDAFIVLEDADRLVGMVVHKPPYIPARLKPVLYADALKYRDQLDGIFWTIANEGRDHPLNERLGEVKAPTLIIWGRHCPASALELPVVAAEGLNRRPASGA